MYKSHLIAPLIGELGAVYGKPVVCLGVSSYVEASIDVSPTENDPFIQEIHETVWKYLIKHGFTGEKQPLTCHFSCETSFVSPTITQSAVIVAAVGAFLQFYTGKESEKTVINELSFAIEKKKYHGLGYMTSTACFGGIVYYRKEFEFLKTVSQLNMRLPKEWQEQMFLLNTSAVDCSDILSQLSSTYNAQPEKAEIYLANLEKQVKRCIVSVSREDLSMFTASLHQADNLTSALVSFPDEIVQITDQLASIGLIKKCLYIQDRKISCLVLVQTPHTDKLTSYAKKSGYTCLPFRM